MNNEINKKNLKAYGFENKVCAEFDWEKRFRSARTSEDGLYQESILGLIEWSDGTWEAYVYTPKSSLHPESSSLLRSVEDMDQIARLYSALTDTKILKING